ncbi:MAG: hypothetical protein JST00_19865 [Deltaproteobacteria bacterium]|nr:hypothetical protein [Deltaproteobacteria bacterium]
MRSACFVSAFVLSAAVLFATSDAHAQQPPADGVAPAAGAGGAPPPPRRGGDAEEFDGGRLRVGFTINGGLGTQSVGGVSLSGPVFGGTFRIGYQITELIAVYGNITPFVWAAGVSGTNAIAASAAAGIQTTPMIGLTPIDLIEVAAGPSLDYLGAASSAVGPGGSTASAGGGAAFGIHGRAALILGGRKDTGRRRGFTISGDVHPIFTSGAVTTLFTLGLGADWY